MSTRSNQDEIPGGVQAGVEAAKVQQVKSILQLVHDLTMKSNFINGYKESREALKKQAQNIQEVLEICSQTNDTATSAISDCLTGSKIYTSSARHFSLLIRTILPSSIVDEFLQRCADIAKRKHHHAIKINFDLLLADQLLIKSTGKTETVDLDDKMKKIQNEFETHEKDFNEDKSLCAHYHYQYGKYSMQKSKQKDRKDRKDWQDQASSHLMQSLKCKGSVADTVYSLLEVGNTYKTFGDKNEKKAKETFDEAIKLSEEKLGKHELTAQCHKYLGDLFLTNEKIKRAVEEYNVVKEMRENLGLDTTERHVFLLNNLGRCLIKDGKIYEALENLERAHDTAEKLPESPKALQCRAKVYASLAIAYDLKRENSKAVKYADEAMKFQEILHKKDVEKMQEILSVETK